MGELKHTKLTFLCGSELQSYTIHQEQELRHAFLLDVDQSVHTEMCGDVLTCFVQLDL